MRAGKNGDRYEPFASGKPLRRMTSEIGDDLVVLRKEDAERVQAAIEAGPPATPAAGAIDADQSSNRRWPESDCQHGGGANDALRFGTRRVGIQLGGRCPMAEVESVLQQDLLAVLPLGA